LPSSSFRQGVKWKIFGKFTFTALMGAGALGMMGANASARTVCNQDGDCWRATSDCAYQPSFGLSVHPDGWKWNEGEKHAWREHDGRGYWKGGSTKEF
jgi:hypothetical protein